MIELMEVIVIVASMALVVLAIAAFVLGMTLIRIESHLERLVLVAEMSRPSAAVTKREKPPDISWKTKTSADEQSASPLVRRAKQRLAQMEQRAMDGE